MLHYIFNLPFLITALQAQVLEITVGQDGNVFTPSTLTVNVGETVVFTWFTGMHNVVQMNDDSCTNITDGGRTSGPPVEEPGKRFALPVSTIGNFWYSCQVHCASGMKGLIVINEREPVPTTVPPLPTPPPSSTTRTLPSNTDGSYPTLPQASDENEMPLPVWITFSLSLGAVVVNLFL